MKKKFTIPKRKTLIIAAVAVAIVAISGFFAFKKFYKPEEYKDYEALVSAREMPGNGSPEEIARSTMHIGDVIALKEGAGNWSTTERVSYLIIKLRLKPSQAEKLTRPLTEKPSKDKVKEEVERFKKASPDMKKEDVKRFEEEAENRDITLKQRAYYIDTEKILPENFDPNTLVDVQPTEGKTFGWEVIEKY